MLLKNILWVLLVSFGATLTAQDNSDMQNLRVDVVYLSSDLLEGRSSGTIGEKLAAEYIASRMNDIGLETMGDKNSYMHTFDFTYKSNPHAEAGQERTARNVIGYIDNGAAHTVIIGAHYDHLGHGEFGSLWTGEPAIHNGADDNASGIAAMLYLAKHLKSSDLKNNNYLFIAFSGEELGLYGSKYFTNHPTLDLSTANYMINMDMVGRLNDEKVIAINGVGTSPAWNLALEQIESGLQTKTSESGVGPSDHTSFYLKDIPAIHFFTGQHADYHKPSDDSELVNYEGLLEVSQFIFKLIKELDDEGELAFTKTKNPSNDRQAAAFKVTLGVMPDYVYQGEGMRIDGVNDDRPAHKAGLEAGDIIIKIGEIDVKDIYDYMEGLSNFKKGDTTRVVVKRKDKVLVRDVTF